MTKTGDDFFEIDNYFDCKHEEVVADVAYAIARSLGLEPVLNTTTADYFAKSKKPFERSILSAAFEVVELLAGDPCDWEIEEEKES